MSRWYPALFILLAFSISCGDPAETPVQATPSGEQHLASGDKPSSDPVVVIGIDGAEWRVIEQLFEVDRMPHLKALVDRGYSSKLGTDYGLSPIVWTSIATGREKEDHGIDGFAVETEQGYKPVSSTLRKVPAIWNMATTLERTVDVIGWWVTWPAEAINGVMVSDRAFAPIEKTFSPDDFQQEFAGFRDLSAGSSEIHIDPTLPRGQIDRIVATIAPRIAEQNNDLLMCYFSTVDTSSHQYWMYSFPEGFSDVPQNLIDKHGDVILSAYQNIDTAIGEIVAAAGPDATFFIVSDHGFREAKHFKPKKEFSFKMNELLQLLDLQVVDAEGQVDVERSAVIVQNSPPRQHRKLLSLKNDGVEQRVRAELAKVTYRDGSPVFSVRRPGGGEASMGADLVADVLADSPSLAIWIDGKTHRGIVTALRFVSGNHDGDTDGIFVAAGPRIDPEAQLDEITIFDMTPTWLYAMGLPVARDMAGRPARELFTKEFQAATRVEVIDTWGSGTASDLATSDVDDEIINDLRALGYLN